MMKDYWTISDLRKQFGKEKEERFTFVYMDYSFQKHIGDFPVQSQLQRLF